MHIREPQIPSQKMFEIKLEGGGGDASLWLYFNRFTILKIKNTFYTIN